MGNTHTVIYDDGDIHVAVVVRRATFLDELTRGEMMGEALRAAPGEAEPTPRERARRTAQVVIWPAVITTVEKVELNGAEAEMTLDSFLSLPPGLVSQWMEAIWALNPDWAPEGHSIEKKE